MTESAARIVFGSTLLSLELGKRILFTEVARIGTDSKQQRKRAKNVIH